MRGLFSPGARQGRFWTTGVEVMLSRFYVAFLTAQCFPQLLHAQKVARVESSHSFCLATAWTATHPNIAGTLGVGSLPLVETKPGS